LVHHVQCILGIGTFTAEILYRSFADCLRASYALFFCMTKHVCKCSSFHISRKYSDAKSLYKTQSSAKDCFYNRRMSAIPFVV